MLSLPPSVRIFVATQPVDGRKGVDSLTAIVRSALAQDPLSGHLYVFFSKRCDRVRVVYWDRNGFAMWTKRMDKGRFIAPWKCPGEGSLEMSRTELRLLLEGSEWVGKVKLSSEVWVPGTP